MKQISWTINCFVPFTLWNASCKSQGNSKHGSNYIAICKLFDNDLSIHLPPPPPQKKSVQYGCFHTTAKCVFWILIWNAHFELRSIHTIEVLAYFELRSIHTSDRNCDLPFESVEKWRGCVWVPCQSNTHVARRLGELEKSARFECAPVISPVCDRPAIFRILVYSTRLISGQTKYFYTILRQSMRMVMH